MNYAETVLLYINFTKTAVTLTPRASHPALHTAYTMYTGSII